MRLLTVMILLLSFASAAFADSSASPITRAQIARQCFGRALIQTVASGSGIGDHNCPTTYLSAGDFVRILSSEFKYGLATDETRQTVRDSLADVHVILAQPLETNLLKISQLLDLQGRLAARSDLAANNQQAMFRLDRAIRYLVRKIYRKIRYHELLILADRNPGRYLQLIQRYSRQLINDDVALARYPLTAEILRLTAKRGHYLQIIMHIMRANSRILKSNSRRRRACADILQELMPASPSSRVSRL